MGKMEMGFKFQMEMGMGIKSLEWDGFGTKKICSRTSLIVLFVRASNILVRKRTQSRIFSHSDLRSDCQSTRHCIVQRQPLDSDSVSTSGVESTASGGDNFTTD